MSLLPKIGRKAPKVRLGIALIYSLLSVGGIAMVYPFLITVTGALSNDLDYYRFSWYPGYWFNSGERYLKYLAERYQGRFEYFKSAYRVPASWGDFRNVPSNQEDMARHFPVYGLESNPEKWKAATQLAADYGEFIQSDYNSRRWAENTIPLFIRWEVATYQTFLRDRYVKHGGQIDTLNPSDLDRDAQDKLALKMIVRERGDYYTSFEDVTLGMYVNYAYHLPKWIATTNLRHLDFVDWVRSLPPEKKMPVSRQYLWFRFLKKNDLTAATYNNLPGIRENGLQINDLTQADYPVGDAIPPALATLRDEFNRREWPIRLRALTVTPALQQAFEVSLKEQFATVEVLNQLAGTDYRKWSDVELENMIPAADDGVSSFDLPVEKLTALSSAWRNFVAKQSDAEIQPVCPEEAWQAFLKTKHGSIEAVNQAYGWNQSTFASIGLPTAVADYVYYVENKHFFLRQFCFYNFSRVFEFMAIRGRALWNTLILVGLSILATLTVNPLAAYALSRFQMRRTNQILIFLLATMAFPPEVAMIPSFLLLRDLHLLNTFGALLLPRLANGFSIFLLKGFFDSLPKELYEAASIDGASETRMFFTITLALSKPILAVLALNAFIASYSGFMWAFLVCQDSKMWTLMVWLFNYQSRMSEYPYMVMAALVLGSIPTLLVFLFCQKIILRGIIVPSMK